MIIYLIFSPITHKHVGELEDLLTADEINKHVVKPTLEILFQDPNDSPKEASIYFI